MQNIVKKSIDYYIINFLSKNLLITVEKKKLRNRYSWFCFIFLKSQKN